MAGLSPMMFGLSLDFIGGGYSINSPTSLWWKQLATAVVFGLGIATVLTLILTPAFLALRVWVGTYLTWIGRLLARLTAGRSSRIARDMRLGRSARKLKATEIIWEDVTDTPPVVEPEVADVVQEAPEQAPEAKSLIAAINESQGTAQIPDNDPEAPVRAAE